MSERQNSPDILSADAALELCLQETHPETVKQLATVDALILKTAKKGDATQVELNYHLRPGVKVLLQAKRYWVRETSGRAGKFTVIDFSASLDTVIKEAQEANKETE